MMNFLQTGVLSSDGNSTGPKQGATPPSLAILCELVLLSMCFCLLDI